MRAHKMNKIKYLLREIQNYKSMNL